MYGIKNCASWIFRVKMRYYIGVYTSYLWFHNSFLIVYHQNYYHKNHTYDIITNFLFLFLSNFFQFCVFQRMQLAIILTSLQDNQHIAALLGLAHNTLHNSSAHSSPPPTPSSYSHQSLKSTFSHTSSQPTQDTTDLQLSELLMKTILRNLAAHTVRSISQLILFWFDRWRGVYWTDPWS